MPTIPNHLEVVKAARTRFAHLSGPERAHHIVNAVAWELRDEGAGLFFKSAGTRFADRSLDIIIFKDGPTFDVLRDAEGKAEPAWARTQPTGMGDTNRWRAPVDPGPIEPTGPGPDPDSTTGTGGAATAPDVVAEIVAEIKAIRNALDALLSRLEP
jgi:hypothetical protein